MVSPCPHTPACPPPACLAPGLRPKPETAAPGRPAPAPDASGSGGPAGGYNVDAGYVRKFAGAMDGSATGVDSIKQHTPRFDGWNLVPLAGVPIIGLAFVGRFNAIADTWQDSARILADVLRTDSGKVSRAADHYVAAAQASTVGKK